MKKLSILAISLSITTFVHAGKPITTQVDRSIRPVERGSSASSTGSAGSLDTPRVTLKTALDNGSVAALSTFLLADAYWFDRKVPVPGQGMLFIHDYVLQSGTTEEKVALLVSLSTVFATNYHAAVARKIGTPVAAIPVQNGKTLLPEASGK